MLLTLRRDAEWRPYVAPFALAQPRSRAPLGNLLIAQQSHAPTRDQRARYSIRQELEGGWTVRFGPLRASEVGVALNAFVR